MANTATVGRYQLTMETQGVWVASQGKDGPLSARPFLSFTLKESGRQPIAFQLQRLYQVDGQTAELHGFTTDRVAFDARIRATENGMLSIDFRVLNATEDMNCRFAARLTLTGEADPRWLVPGFFYGNNKPQGCTRLFPAYSEMTRDPRRLSSNFWAFRSDRATVPMVSAWTYGGFTYMMTDGVFGRSRENQRGVGMTGMMFGTEDGHPLLAVEFPYREAPIKYSYCHEDRLEPEEIFLMLPEKVPLIGSFQIGLEEPEMHAYNKPIRAFYKERQQANATRARMAPEWAEHSAHTGLLRWHYDGRNAAIYESINFSRPVGRRHAPGERLHMHAGWQSGLLPAYALLWAGRETKHNESITAGTAVFNKFSSQLAPAGTIFPVWTEENGWSCSFGPDEGSAHSRTVAEAILFMLRAIVLEISHGSSHPSWSEAVLSSLKYAMGVQREDGAFPAFYDLATGSAKTYEGCGGLGWVAAMAAGAAIFQSNFHREVARRGGKYYAKYAESEFLYGAVEDQHLVPSAEDCHWAVIAYILLYEMDRDIQWLQLARKMADLACTWRYAYNVVFGAETMAGRLDLRTRGGDLCSAAVPLTGCYGLLSYREFLKLAAYTGDDYYLERAEDARAFATQLIAREDGQLNARIGMVAPYFYATDWLQPKGILHMQSHAMSAAVIKYAELTRRNLNVNRLTYEAARNGAMQRELEAAPVMYADVALSEEVGLGELSSTAISKLPAVGQGTGMSGVFLKPTSMNSEPFEKQNVAPGQDLLSGLSSHLGINRDQAPGPGGASPPHGVPQTPAHPGGAAPRFPAPPDPGPNGPRSGVPPQYAPPPRGPRQSGVHQRPAAGGTNSGSSDPAQAELSRAMTNTLSSVLGLGSMGPPPGGSSPANRLPGNHPPTTPPPHPHGPEDPNLGPGAVPFSFNPPPGQAASPPAAGRPGQPHPPNESQNEGDDEIKYKIF